jgi:hypothetical protein
MSEAMREGDENHQLKEAMSRLLTPELLELARNELSEEEIVAGLREIRATGGLELKDFIHELEQEVAPRE